MKIAVEKFATGVTFNASKENAEVVEQGVVDTGVRACFEESAFYKKYAVGSVINSTESEEKTIVSYSTSNGFIASALHAYNLHHNLVWRPDDIFIAILSQFAMYISCNAEKFRDKFVSHQGQKQLKAVLNFPGKSCSPRKAPFRTV